MKLRITTLALLVIGGMANATPHQQEKYPQNANMVQLGQLMENLYPLVFSESKFKDPKNQPAIKHDIEKLISVFEKSSTHFNHKSITYKISYDVLLQHLKDTEKVYSKPDLDRANHMLRAIPSMCASCHTQDSGAQKHFLGLDRSHFGSDFDFAEFSFTTRDYGNAIFYYDRFLTRGGTYRSEKNTEVALQRLMTLYAQVNKDLNMAANYLNEYVRYIKEYPLLKRKLKVWVKSIQDAHEKFNTGYNSLEYMSFKDIHGFVDAYLWEDGKNQTDKTDLVEKNNALEEDKVPYYVILRGIIYRYLDDKPKEEEIPALLYWLAKCDKALNFNFYVSYADMYLKECYTKYPSTPYAELCRKEYSTYTTLAKNEDW